MNKKIKTIKIKDKEYPEKLKNIENPPKQIYVLGNSSILNDFSISIVGCRLCSEYGKMMAQSIAYNLSKYNINIVSGLALGIDTNAHKGCLMNKGKTIAVLAHGLDMIYPTQNTDLANKIIESGGAIISEYPVGIKPKRENFPERNRLISGLSNGVVVIEAKEKSGALITVESALEQGKDIFAIPGNINSTNSIGTNNLIKEGAKITTCVNDILEEYKFN